MSTCARCCHVTNPSAVQPSLRFTLGSWVHGTKAQGIFFVSIASSRQSYIHIYIQYYISILSRVSGIPLPYWLRKHGGMWWICSFWYYILERFDYHDAAMVHDGKPQICAYKLNKHIMFRAKMCSCIAALYGWIQPPNARDGSHLAVSSTRSKPHQLTPKFVMRSRMSFAISLGNDL